MASKIMQRIMIIIIIISYQDKITDDEVLLAAGTRSKVSVEIPERQSKSLGHAMRRDGMQNGVTTGMVNGEESRGQRVKNLEPMAAWLFGMNVACCLMHTVRGNKTHRDMTTNKAPEVERLHNCIIKFQPPRNTFFIPIVVLLISWPK